MPNARTPEETNRPRHERTFEGTSSVARLDVLTGPDKPKPAALNKPGETRFERAHSECGSPDYVELLDEGNGLDIQSEGEEGAGASFDEVTCVLDVLNTPESITRRIDNTRAMDGTQTASWSGISASWTYHPDDGLSMVLDQARSAASSGS